MPITITGRNGDEPFLRHPCESWDRHRPGTELAAKGPSFRWGDGWGVLMEIATILIALALLFVAWKVITGIIKFGVMALIVLVAGYMLYSGGFF